MYCIPSISPPMALSSEHEDHNDQLSSSTVDLPLDVSFEILSRCSLETIAKFRTLSRQLNSLTYQSNFTQLHHRRNQTLSGFFLRGTSSRRSLSTFGSYAATNHNNNHATLDFLPSHARILASTPQGFMTCVTDEPRLHRYYVVKPATKQWVPVPNPKTKHFTRHPVGMIVLRSNPLRFKIVRLSNSNINTFNLRCEVFDSEGWSWKQPDRNVVQLLEDEYLEPEPPVSARGSLHWLTSRGRVMAFHGDTNVWGFFPLPRECSGKDRYYGSVQLAEYEGKLGLMYTCRESCVIQLWVVERYYYGGENNKLWELRLTLDLKEGFGGGGAHALGFCGADTVVLERDDGAVVLYEFRVGRVRVLEGLRCPSCLNGFFVVRSDLERSDFGRPEESASSDAMRRPRRPRGKKKDDVLDREIGPQEDDTNCLS